MPNLRPDALRNAIMVRGGGESAYCDLQGNPLSTGEILQLLTDLPAPLSLQINRFAVLTDD
jgi:hypothetical protein